MFVRTNVIRFTRLFITVRKISLDVLCAISHKDAVSTFAKEVTREARANYGKQTMFNNCRF